MEGTLMEVHLVLFLIIVILCSQSVDCETLQKRERRYKLQDLLRWQVADSDGERFKHKGESMEWDKRNVKGDVVFLRKGHVVFIYVCCAVTVNLEGANIGESSDPAARLFRSECGTESADGERLGVAAWGGEWDRECTLPQLELPPGGELDFFKQVLAGPWDP
jgi:hypothetical protein